MTEQGMRYRTSIQPYVTEPVLLRQVITNKYCCPLSPIKSLDLIDPMSSEPMSGDHTMKRTAEDDSNAPSAAAAAPAGAAEVRDLSSAPASAAPAPPSTLGTYANRHRAQTTPHITKIESPTHVRALINARTRTRAHVRTRTHNSQHVHGFHIVSQCLSTYHYVRPEAQAKAQPRFLRTSCKPDDCCISIER